MSSKITKSWMVKRAIARGWIVWAQPTVFVIFSLVVCSSSAWHSAEPTFQVSSAQYQNPVAGFSHSSSEHQHYQENSWATRVKQFAQDYVRISTPHCQPSHHKQTSNLPLHQADFARALANSSQQYISWFFDQQILIGTMTQDQVLCLYKLYSNPGFLAYIKHFPGYGDHILSVYGRLINPANNRKKIFQEMGLKESVSTFNLFARCAQEVKDRRAAQEQERALRAQAARLQQEERARKIEVEPPQPEAKNGKSRYSKAEALANCVVGWHKKQHGANGARYKKRLAAAQKLAQNLDQNKQKIKRVYKITDRDHELIKELNLRKSDFVVLQGHELQHVLHREFIGIMRNISDIRHVTVGSITGQDWTELLGTYLDTGMQVNKMGDCAQASKIADFCWTVTAGLGEIVLGVGEGIWQGGKNVAYMVLHPLDTGYGAACALGVMLIGCGDIIMSTGDPELPIDNEYSTFQRARDPAQADYLLHVYNSVTAQAKQATPRDIARGVSTMVTEAILTAKLSSAAVKCITSINSRVPGALHRAFSCAPEAAESFALADGGHMRFSKNALQALAESEAAGSGAAVAIESKAYDVIDRFNKNRNLIGAFDQKIQKLAKKTCSKRVGKTLTIDTHITKVEKIEAEAALFYDSMRQTMADVESIAKNTGLPKDVISRIKKHVFLEEHILDEGIRKFWPDADMAAAWKRLMAGDFVSSDLLLLQHEYAEAFIMNGIEIPYRQAHDFVDTLYNWSNAL